MRKPYREDNCVNSFNHSTSEKRHEDLCHLEASLICRASSMAERLVAQRIPVSTNKQEKNKKPSKKKKDDKRN